MKKNNLFKNEKIIFPIKIKKSNENDINEFILNNEKNKFKSLSQKNIYKNNFSPKEKNLFSNKIKFSKEKNFNQTQNVFLSPLNSSSKNYEFSNILNETVSSKNKKQKIYSLKEIIEKMPNFIKRNLKNEKISFSYKINNNNNNINDNNIK